MDHMEIGEACKHILKTVPTTGQETKLKHRSMLRAWIIELSWTGLVQSNLQYIHEVRKRSKSNTNLLFRSCIGKFANREITSSILHGAPSFSNTKKASDHIGNGPRIKHSCYNIASSELDMDTLVSLHRYSTINISWVVSLPLEISYEASASFKAIVLCTNI